MEAAAKPQITRTHVDLWWRRVSLGADVWFLPNRGYLLCTHQSSRVWYVDPDGYIHLLLAGYPNAQPAGDGTWFYNLSEARVSECRAVTMDYQGNNIITDNDSGYIRKIEFLRLNHQSAVGIHYSAPNERGPSYLP